MAKAGKEGPKFASLNPDDMLAGGLPSDFRGTITDAAYVKWDYEGTSDKPVLGVRLTIKPDDPEVNKGKPVVQVYSAGDLQFWAPSDEDGEVQDEGPYAVRVGKKAEMSNNTNYAHLMETILDSGEAAKGKPFTRKNLTSSVECLVRLDAQWVRVPQKQRKGLVDLNDPAEAAEAAPTKARTKEILAVVEVFGYDPDGAAEAPKPKAKAAKAAPVEEDEPEPEEEAAEEAAELSPLDAGLTKVIVKAILKAGGALKKGKLAALVLAAYATDKAKNKAVSRSAEEEFLSASEAWKFDEDTGILSIED